jgi:hypothetical protein
MCFSEPARIFLSFINHLRPLLQTDRGRIFALPKFNSRTTTGDQNGAYI